MAFPGTPVGDLIHRRALSSANRPGDPYHHPLGAMNPQFAYHRVVKHPVLHCSPMDPHIAIGQQQMDEVELNHNDLRLLTPSTFHLDVPTHTAEHTHSLDASGCVTRLP